MRVDVCIPTLNSEKTLDLCLKHAKSSIPYNRIIICDGYSCDKTIEIAKKHKCLIIFSRKKLGKVREELIKRVRTEWFVFLDSDVIVNKKWFNSLVAQLDEKTGAINGFGLPRGLLGDLRKLILFLKLKLGLWQRGFTSNTLIRKEAVNGIKFPAVNRLEDIYLQKKVRERGYKWKFAFVFCTHLKSSKQILKEALSDLLNLSREVGFLNAILQL